MSDHPDPIDEAIRQQEQMLMAKKLGPKKKPLIQKDHKYFDSIEMCKQKPGIESLNDDSEKLVYEHKTTDHHQ